MCSQISHSGQWPIWILDQGSPPLSVSTHRIFRKHPGCGKKQFRFCISVTVCFLLGPPTWKKRIELQICKCTASELVLHACLDYLQRTPFFLFFHAVFLQYGHWSTPVVQSSKVDFNASASGEFCCPASKMVLQACLEYLLSKKNPSYLFSV